MAKDSIMSDSVTKASDNLMIAMTEALTAMHPVMLELLKYDEKLIKLERLKTAWVKACDWYPALEEILPLEDVLDLQPGESLDKEYGETHE